MLSGLGLRRTRWTASRVLGVGYLGGGVVFLLTIAFPYADRHLPVAPFLGVLGLACGAALLRFGAGLPAPALLAVTYLGVGVIGLITWLALTESGQVLNASALIWIGLFGAWFLPRRQLVVLLVVMSAVLASALAASSFAFRPSGFLTIVANIWAISLLLHHMVRDARHDADHDQLTGVLVRAAFLRRAGDAMTAARRTAEDLVLVVVDLDDLKRVNDTGGHTAGDRLLADAASRWRAALDPEHLAGRLGGDEFVFLLRDTDEAGAAATVRRMAEASGDVRWSHGATAWRRENLATWLDRTDRELYADKRSRRADVEHDTRR